VQVARKTIICPCSSPESNGCGSSVVTNIKTEKIKQSGSIVTRLLHCYATILHPGLGVLFFGGIGDEVVDGASPEVQKMLVLQ